MGEEQSTSSSTFTRKPFYKWWFNKCFECNKRSFWKPMVKCTICKHYNHRSCIHPDHNVGYVDATRRDCTNLSDHDTPSTSQGNSQCFGPIVVMRPGHIIKLEMCRCSKSPLAKNRVLNLLGPHQRISYDDESEIELEEDEPQLMVKRRCLKNIRERIYKLLTGKPWPVDQIIADASLEDVVNPAENVTAETRHHEPDGMAIANSIEYVHVVDLEMRVDSSLKPGLDNSDDQLSNSVDDASVAVVNDASVVVVDDVVRAAGKLQPTEKETTVECVNAAQKADDQCITVANEQSPMFTTAKEPKTTSVLHDIEVQGVCKSNTFERVCCDDGTPNEQSTSLVITMDKSTFLDSETQYQCGETVELKTSLECGSPTKKRIADENLTLPSLDVAQGKAIDADKKPRQDDHVNNAVQLETCNDDTPKYET